MHYNVKLVAEDAVASVRAKMPPHVLAQLGPEGVEITSANEGDAARLLRELFPYLVARPPVRDSRDGQPVMRLDVYRSFADVTDDPVAHVFATPDDPVEAAGLILGTPVPHYDFRLWLTEREIEAVEEQLAQGRPPPS